MRADGVPAPRSPGGLQLAAVNRHAFTQRDEAVLARTRPRPVVRDLEVEGVVCVANRDAGEHRTGVRERVRQRVLDDPERGEVDPGRQRLRSSLERYCERFEESGAAPVLDLGCGRGEFLEMLRERGIPGYGIDRDPLAVAGARSRGLDVREGDLLSGLRAWPDGSLGAIVAFQVIEHLSLTEVRELLAVSRAGFDTVGELLGRNRFKQAVSEAMRVVSAANRYLSDQEPWKRKDRALVVASKESRAGEWHRVRVDVRRHYSALFSKDDPPPAGVAISAPESTRGGQAAVDYRDFRLCRYAEAP